MNPADRTDQPDELDLELEQWFTASAPWRARNGLLGEILDQTTTMRQHRRPYRWSPVRLAPALILPRPVFIVLTILLVAAIGGGAIAAGSLMLSTVARPAPRPALSWTGWQPLPDTSAFGNRTVADVIVAGPGLVAVGGAVTGTHNVAAAWSSADGLAWTEQASAASFDNLVAQRIARHGSTLVAIGQTCSGAMQYLCTDSLFSVSTDGRTWRAAAMSFVNQGPAGWGPAYQSIAATPAGFVAVGSTGDLAGNTTIGASVATSTDGLNWTSLPPTLPQFAARSMGAVAAGPGGLVAIGTDASLATLVWTSVDGSSWELVSGGPVPQGRLTDVAGGPNGYVAVGSAGNDAVAWSSPDGRAWTAAPTSPALADATMTRVLSTGSTFVALGRSGNGDGNAWASPDGLSWTRLDTGALFAGAPIVSGVVVGSRLELFGTSAGGKLVAAISAP